MAIVKMKYVSVATDESHIDEMVLDGVHSGLLHAVHAADARGQAARAGGGAVRVRRGRRGAAHRGRGAADDRRREARRAAAPDV